MTLPRKAVPALAHDPRVTRLTLLCHFARYPRHLFGAPGAARYAEVGLDIRVFHNSLGIGLAPRITAGAAMGMRKHLGNLMYSGIDMNMKVSGSQGKNKTEDNGED
ncbi:MAG: hypothetical protein MUF22_09395 [Chitinispirillaceae bacterium]|nr:hypothetical protein [Chitinispirillaceae bacterium]